MMEYLPFSEIRWLGVSYLFPKRITNSLRLNGNLHHLASVLLDGAERGQG